DRRAPGGRHRRHRRRRRLDPHGALRRRDRRTARRLDTAGAALRLGRAGEVRGSRLVCERGSSYEALTDHDAPADHEAPLRRDVRLLGEILGRVIVEQEGEELLAEEERIRTLSREERAAGEAGPRSDLAAAVRALPLERQAKVLRAFGLYFQLTNLAEQHHRLRRRRQYEAEGR